MLRRPKHSKIEVVAPKEEDFNSGGQNPWWKINFMQKDKTKC